jgi:hypothetical protein
MLEMLNGVPELSEFYIFEGVAKTVNHFSPFPLQNSDLSTQSGLC